MASTSSYSLDSLPFELRQLILINCDLESIRNLVIASSVYYHHWQAEGTRVSRVLQQDVLSSMMPEAFAVLVSTFTMPVREDHWWNYVTHEPDVYGLFREANLWQDEDEVEEDDDKINSKPTRLKTGMTFRNGSVIWMQRYKKDVIEPLVTAYAKWAMRQFQKEIGRLQKGECSKSDALDDHCNVDLSRSEWDRIERAFWRYQLVCNFAIAVDIEEFDSALLGDLSLPPQFGEALMLWETWEHEEIVCVDEFVQAMYNAFLGDSVHDSSTLDDKTNDAKTFFSLSRSLDACGTQFAKSLGRKFIRLRISSSLYP
jgi:hypothetical protein